MCLRVFQPECVYKKKNVHMLQEIYNKKKIDKSIDFLRGWEKKMVSIFRLRRCAEVGVS